MAPKPAKKAPKVKLTQMSSRKRAQPKRTNGSANDASVGVTKRPAGMVPTPKADMLNEQNFVNMTLDPCNGPLTRSPFGATENAYLWRLNFRRTVQANTGGYLAAALNPLGIYQGGGSSLINWWAQAGLNDGAASLPASSAVGMPGSASLTGIAAQVRIIAGCIKLNYIGAASASQGQLIGWEGQADEVFSGGTAYTNTRCLSDFAVNGNTYPLDVGVESRLSYAKASPQQLQYGDVNLPRMDVFSPCAFVGVSGGPSSAYYVLEATVVVEWTPNLYVGIPAPSPVMAKPGAADRVANALRSVSPLLVSAVRPLLGPYAAAFGTAVTFAGRVAKQVMA